MNIFANARWITALGITADTPDKYAVYKVAFAASAGEKTTLYIAVSSQYAVYVNGQFADCGRYDDTEDHPTYDALDITPFLQDGANELVVRQYSAGWDFSTRPKEIPGVIFSIFAGEKELLSSSPACLSAVDSRYNTDLEIITPQLGFTFDYDATAQAPVFQKSLPVEKPTDFTPRPIKKLTVGAINKGKVLSRGSFRDADPTLPKARRMQTAYLSPDPAELTGKENPYGGSWSIATAADGQYFILDLGDETAGLLAFSLTVPESAEVLIGFGEHLADNRVRTAIGNRNFCMRYVAHAGENTFFYPFQRLGLRYLQCHIYAESGTLHYAGIRPTDYPLNRVPFVLKNPLDQQIYDIGCKTLSLCMHEHYEDCPWREQSLYAMDSRIQMLCGYYAFREFDFPKATLRLMSHSLRPDGLLELCPPGKVPVNIPNFTAVFVREVLEYLQYSDDMDFVLELLPTLLKITDGFERRLNNSGLIETYTGDGYWNFYEWRDGLDGAEPPRSPYLESPLNAFVADAFGCMAEICQVVCPEKAEHYFGLKQRMDAAIHHTFFDPQSGAYFTRSGDKKPRHILTQALLLFIGAVPPEQISAVEQTVRAGELIPSSVSMTIYVFEALLRNEQNRPWVLAEIRRIWGGMLERGAKTFWETEKGEADFDGAGSLCHGWSAVPVYLFGKYFAN